MIDYATVTDNTGRKADFRNVIIIMTSNLEARDIGKDVYLGFASNKNDQDNYDKMKNKVLDELKKLY